MKIGGTEQWHIKLPMIAYPAALALTLALWKQFPKVMENMKLMLTSAPAAVHVQMLAL